MLGHSWYPANRTALVALLQGEARGPAVFDWDNTCIFNDIGDATFRFQLDQMAFKLTPKQAAANLPAALEGLQVLANDFDLAQQSPALLAAYTQIWPAVHAGNRSSWRGSAAHLRWRAGLGAMYVAIERTPELGARVAYPWLARWLGGFSESEIERLAQSAWEAVATEPLGEATWVSHGLSFAFRTGIVAHPEMRDLMAALAAQHFPVFVVTASHEAVVRGVVRSLRFPVQAERIFGMRPLQADYPLTYRAGKVEVIRTYLPSAPLLVAGDTNTDYDMLTAFEQTRLRLVLHRYVRGDIERLHAAALADRPAGDAPQTLLQGRDERTGAFVTAQKSIRA